MTTLISKMQQLKASFIKFKHESGQAIQTLISRLGSALRFIFMFFSAALFMGTVVLCIVTFCSHFTIVIRFISPVIGYVVFMYTWGLLRPDKDVED